MTRKVFFLIGLLLSACAEKDSKVATSLENQPLAVDAIYGTWEIEKITFKETGEAFRISGRHEATFLSNDTYYITTKNFTAANKAIILNSNCTSFKNGRFQIEADEIKSFDEVSASTQGKCSNYSSPYIFKSTGEGKFNFKLKNGNLMISSVYRTNEQTVNLWLHFTRTGKSESDYSVDGSRTYIGTWANWFCDDSHLQSGQLRFTGDHQLAIKDSVYNSIHRSFSVESSSVCSGTNQGVVDVGDLNIKFENRTRGSNCEFLSSEKNEVINRAQVDSSGTLILITKYYSDDFRCLIDEISLYEQN